MESQDRLRHALGEAGLRRERQAGGASQPDAWRSARESRATVYQHGLGPPPQRQEPGVESYLPGFWQDTPAGRVFVVEQRFDLEHRHGAYPLGRTLALPGQVLARIGRDRALAGVDHQRLLYLDTETTGLAGGAGTVAFLVGIGHFLDGGFRLRQYFLDSLDREEALLRALADYLDGFDAIVTFNGKSFDLPLLETRFILARLRREVRSLPQLDLLFPARRLYRDRFGSCRLGELERQVLGLTRVEDVPSFEIPSLYFRYVRQRRFRALIPVFHHNALDVLSMVTLMAHIGALYEGGPPTAAEDALALGRVCEGDGYHEEALAHYHAALAAGLPPAPREQTERLLSLLYKRLGHWQEAVDLWSEIAGRPDNRALYPLIELAKHYERTARDIPAAVDHTEQALALVRRHHLRLGAAGAQTEEARLQKRLERLQRRQAQGS